MVRVQGLGFRVQGLGFRVQGSGFRVQGSGFRVQGIGHRVQDLGLRVWESAITTLSGCRVEEAQFKNNYFAEMCSGSEEGSYLRLIDLCFTQL